jgi:excisionase family DNA binding protein
MHPAFEAPDGAAEAVPFEVDEPAAQDGARAGGEAGPPRPVAETEPPGGLEQERMQILLFVPGQLVANGVRAGDGRHESLGVADVVEGERSGHLNPNLAGRPVAARVAEQQHMETMRSVERRDGWLTVQELAAELRVHPSAVYRAVQRGELRALRLSGMGALRIPAGELRRLTGGHE